MSLFNFLKEIFGKKEKKSKLIAKERLKQVLLHDRVDISPQFMRAIRYDVVGAVSQYMEINEQDVQIQMSASENRVSLVADIPVIRIRHQIKLQIDSGYRNLAK
jgi:cell division topological specificity factor